METYVVVDIETTGHDPEEHEIIEIGAVKIKDGQIIDTWETLVRPREKIPLKITELTGITNKSVKDAPLIDEVISPFVNFIGSSIIVGHNVGFDLSFINKAALIPLTNETLDTLEIARVVYPLLPSHRLSNLTRQLEISHDKKHRALDDALATAQLFLNLIDSFKNFSWYLLRQINNLIKDTEWPLKRITFAIEQEMLRKFPVEKLGTGEIYPLTEDGEDNLFIKSRKEKNNRDFKFKEELIEKILGNKGILKKKFPGYEPRKQQKEMVQAVCASFNENKHLLMEAGTGTGKSLAYLIPAIYWSVNKKQKVVIATHTINLQEQLWNKDIPLLEKILNLPFKGVIVKGRNNYLCLNKWNAKIKSGPATECEAKFYAFVLSWLYQTRTGDRSELNIPGTLKYLWEAVSAERDYCLGPGCPWYSKGCFVMKARKRAEDADILIVNHSLLLADIKTENRVLPSYDYLVIDEAHHLEDEASANLGIEFSGSIINNYLNGLWRGYGEKANPGFIGNLKLRFSKLAEKLDKDEEETLAKYMDEAIEYIISIRQAVDVFFNLLGSFIKNVQDEGDYGSLTLRIKDEQRTGPGWSALEEARANLVFRFKMLLDKLKNIASFFEISNQEIFASEIREAVGFYENGKKIIWSLDFFGQGSGDHVYWLEGKKGDDKYLTVKMAPIRVREILFKELFNCKKAVIMTSATLTVEGSFQHFEERVGLDLVPEERIIRKILESPFEYEKQALLCIPRDLPVPGEDNDEKFIEEFSPFLIKLVTATEGRTLVLFTSHKMLKDVYIKIKPKLEEEGIILLGHNIDGGRMKLIEEFKESDKCVLFGASSFWEGVDLPGEVLKSVVMVKIPFWPPTIPVVEARLEELDKRKQNGFRQYSLPQAVIKLKQGFGRLIRTQKDLGVVVIIDNRIIEKNYGRIFLKSLPLKRHVRGEKEMIIKKVKEWLEGKDRESVNFKEINDVESLLRCLKR